MDFIAKLFDAIKLSSKHLFPIFLVTGFLLLFPAQYRAIFGLDGFVNSYKAWIGIVFLLSFAILSSRLLINIAMWIKTKLEEQKSFGLMKSRLRNLTPGEKTILRRYIFNQTKTLVLDGADGVVNGLIHAEIIYQSSGVGTLRDGFAHNIMPWAWEVLNKKVHWELP